MFWWMAILSETNSDSKLDSLYFGFRIFHMRLELKVPEVGESITEVEIAGWLKNQGDVVKKDEPLVTLDSEKATVELPAPDTGIITQVLKQKGEVAKVGEIIAYLE